MMPASGGAGESNPMSPQNLAAAFTMYNKLVGDGGNGSAGQQVINNLLNKEEPAKAEGKLYPTGQGQQKKRVSYHDDKALF